MRILVTADLHYDIARSREPARDLARRAVQAGGDALVLLGDTAGRELGPFAECLRLFADFPGRKLLVPGNHCLWCRAGETSMQRYEQVLPDLAASEGFAVLDHRPEVLGDVGLAGSIGWYDYSLRDESLGIPVEFYRVKMAPGAAGRLGEHADILERYKGVLGERQLSIVTRWMDGWNVRLGSSDEEFLALLAGKLRRQLADLSARSQRIVAFLHHVPFAELVPPGRPDRFAFAAAYMGSPLLGRVLQEFPAVRDVYCGHTHWPGVHQIGPIRVVNVGSTYTEKHMEVLDI